MPQRPSPSRLRTGIAAAMVLGLGALTVYLLAGGGNSSRQDHPNVAALSDQPGSTAAGEAPAALPRPVATSPTFPAAPPATTAVTVPPTVPSSRPSPAPAAAAGRATAGSLAGAWIAAGAQGIDPDAMPGPAAASGSAGPTPVRIEIPVIGVSAPVDPAGKNDDGTLQVPADFARTSFYTGRPVPGDPGPAIIVGHVDSRRGPAVFYRLRDLQPGAEVVIHRADGSQVVFVVERSKQVPKRAFPTEEVYGPTPEPTLRLITCGGSFDRGSGHYRDNIVVFLRVRV